ncbi:uncharacterized protein LOC124139656 [Haliotis rufescens]|uniref:uncharacterized protein LOC124139656 n=1 Tax=Haliotis rufescens TaxID=6454 RepID=UPI00201F22B4|nr:uncharacterized protein LOC124139656 [Haliotis rufescens]XP_048244027.1 uncharacterized protein LOC124139656 [Haliotis rufescens]XP_048244028.1 uncharacterized protein LOC124139656 [Haliotis rufescens]
MYYKFTAEYKMTPPSRHAFIEGFSAGIVSVYASFKLKRRWRVVSTKGYNCGGASRSSPDTDLYTCEGAPLLPLPFQHRDIIEFSYKASNGGYVKVRNKETKNLVTHYYSGATQTRTFTMTIDLVAPYHCTGTTACISSMLTAPNVITTPTVNLRWSGWSDAAAGVDHFVRDVYELYVVGDVLRDKRRIARKTFTSSVGSSVYTTDKFRLLTSGVYSVVLSAYDKAGNHRSARRILIYDGTSSVTTQANKKLRVTTAASATSEWQTTSSAVTVDWTNRYINTVHHNKKWLQSVAPLADIGSGYDDKEGSRGVDEVRNVQGITSFRTSYKVDHKGGSSITSPPAVFTIQGLSQSQTITPSLVDGDTVRFWVRAYDIMSDTKEESVTVHIDTSPPVIENLWLTRNGSLNISVHGVKELNDVIMEWNLYDGHSGVEAVEWRIVEKRQDEDMVLAVHGISIKSYLTMGACNTISGTRDGGCYCTPHGRCYHPHFQVKPSPADIKKVKVKFADGKEYCFQVKATNHAKLKTEQEVKITIDASPPRSGIVHDGQSGQPEVDYQDSLQLHAHWDGFFDRESAISFYQYTFGPRCLQGDLFDLNQTKNMESTRSTEVSWTAPSCGTFYVTVVAYNGAQQRSDAVCSDGVETCNPTPVLSEPSKSEGNPLVGKTLVLILSGTGSAVVAVAGIIVGVVVWKRKQRRQPESPGQAVYYNTGLSKKVKPKKTKPRTNRSKPEARTYDTLDVNSRDTGPGEEAYCSIQTPGADDNIMYEPIDSQMYLNSCLPPRVTSDTTSNDLYEEI